MNILDIITVILVLVTDVKPPNHHKEEAWIYARKISLTAWTENLISMIQVDLQAAEEALSY